MAGLCAKLRVLLFVGTVLSLVPCRYRYKMNRFEAKSCLSLFAFTINISLSSAHMYYDWWQFWSGNRQHSSHILYFFQLVHTVTYPSTVVCVQLVTFSNRVHIAALFNALFTDRSWQFVGDFHTNRWHASSYWLGRFSTAVTVGGMVYIALLISSIYKSIAPFLKYVTILEGLRVYVTLTAIFIYIVCVQVVKMHLKQVQEWIERFGSSVNTPRLWCIFMDQYAAAVGMVQEINRIFSVPLLTILAQVQVQLSFQYLMLYCSTQQRLGSIAYGLMLFHTQCWESMFLLMLLAVGYTCGSCHDQIENVNVAVRSSVATVKGDPSHTRKWINRFLLQTLCQTDQHRFRVGGLFVLDNKFVCMALTSMATYLVILIQFEQYEIANESLMSSNVSYTYF
uniref:Gustatory receptor n=1 Tax=Anopheles epiroticus TaxID=199890 RepID=A0A182PYY5_9DIPT